MEANRIVKNKYNAIETMETTTCTTQKMNTLHTFTVYVNRIGIMQVLFRSVRCYYSLLHKWFWHKILCSWHWHIFL